MAESIRELRKICYENSKGRRPMYMEWVTMKISIYVTKLLLYTPIRADQVTISMILLVIFGSILMALGSLKYMLAGILLIHFTVVLDNVNGEIARYRKEGSMMGTFLEQLYHDLSVPMMFFSFGYGAFLLTNKRSAIIFGFLCALFSKSVVLPPIKSAAIKNALRDNESAKTAEKLKKYSQMIGKPNVAGGGTESGAKLYKSYEHIKEFWGWPFNILHINLIIIFEIINNIYHLFPNYALLYWYIVVYGALSVIIQLVSFIVHYKGRTVYHYYVGLFKKK